jgi:hypothetical protein
MLLDVDGVLNPYGFADVPAGFTPHQLFERDDPVWLNPEHGGWITELQAAYEVVWATSWNEDANRLLAPLLGIAPLAMLPMPSAAFDPRAKLNRIDRFVRDRPVAWIDDLHAASAARWAQDRRAPTLLIPADSAVGLTRAIIDEAIAWVQLDH